MIDHLEPVYTSSDIEIVTRVIRFLHVVRVYFIWYKRPLVRVLFALPVPNHAQRSG